MSYEGVRAEVARKFANEWRYRTGTITTHEGTIAVEAVTLPEFSDLDVGLPIFAQGIATGAMIRSVDTGPTHANMSAASTADGTVDAILGYPVVAENQPFPGGKEPTIPWARYSVRPAANVSRTVDASMSQVVGLVWLQIFVPEMWGTKHATAMADEMERLFAETRIIYGNGLIRFERAELSMDAPNNGWQQWKVTVRYRDDVIHS